MILDKTELSKRIALVTDYIDKTLLKNVIDAYLKSVSFDDLPNDIKKIIVDAEKKRDYELGIR